MFAAAIIASSAVIGWITDTAILPVLRDGEPGSSKVLPVVAAVLGVSVWKASAIVMRRTSAGWLQLRNQQDLRRQLVGHQLELELGWFARQSIGNLLSVADNDTERSTGVLGPLPYSTGVSLLVIGTVVLLAITDIWLGLVALVGMTAVVWVEVRSVISLYPAWEGIQVQLGLVSGVAHESFDGALTIKALGREDYETERLRIASDELRDRNIFVGVRWETYRTIITVLLPAIGLVVLLVGSVRVQAGAITPGDIVTALYLLSLLAFPIQLIAFVLFDLAAGIPAWERVAAVLAAEERVVYGDTMARPEAGAASVDSDSVAFHYETDEEILPWAIRWATRLPPLPLALSLRATSYLQAQRLRELAQPIRQADHQARQLAGRQGCALLHRPNLPGQFVLSFGMLLLLPFGIPVLIMMTNIV